MFSLMTRGRKPPPPVPPLKWDPPRGAFCIPNGAPGLPFGDGRRIWDPAFACYDVPDQQRILNAHLDRGHNTLEYQLSGWPYHQDYPEIPVNPYQALADLTLIKQYGLQTMVAFDDTRWPDLSYLAPVARLTQHVVDCVMGIYEVNGVVQDLEVYFSILEQSKALWPRAKQAVHLMDVMGGESYGFFTADGWRRCRDLGLNLFLLQAAGWRYTTSAVAARIADYTRRLGGPEMHGYPTLSDGVVQFEVVTTELYHEGWSEAQGVAFNDDVRRQVPGHPDGPFVSVPVTGFMDSGQDPVHAALS